MSYVVTHRFAQVVVDDIAAAAELLVDFWLQAPDENIRVDRVDRETGEVSYISLFERQQIIMRLRIIAVVVDSDDTT